MKGTRSTPKAFCLDLSTAENLFSRNFLTEKPPHFLSKLRRQAFGEERVPLGSEIKILL